MFGEGYACDAGEKMVHTAAPPGARSHVDSLGRGAQDSARLRGRDRSHM